ncbi:60S ribosomal protein L31 [Dictyocoela muelleri]|nr:60S ribosomal protein L31 [Dictyocoela muelleri]
MTTDLKERRPLEMTINLRKITKNDSWRWKSKQCIKRIKKFMQKYFKTESEVMIAPDLNKAIWEKGMHKVPSRIRVRVERDMHRKDPSKEVIKVSYVIVGDFKSLGTEAVTE